MSPTWKESALFIEQNRLRNTDFSDKFNAFLSQIEAICQKETRAQTDKKIKVFISYAHPMSQEDREALPPELQEALKNEDWTKAFILNLASDLRTAGLEVAIDEEDSPPGQPIKKFMTDGVADADCCILVGSRTLHTKATRKNRHGQRYAVHFEVLSIIKKILESAFDPIKKLLKKKEVPRRFRDEVQELRNRLDTLLRQDEHVEAQWKSIKNDIKVCIEKLRQARLFIQEKANPIIPIIISGDCKTAMPFFTGELGILEFSNNGSGEHIHKGYTEEIIRLIKNIYEQCSIQEAPRQKRGPAWDVLGFFSTQLPPLPRPKINKILIEKVVSKFKQDNDDKLPWLNWLSRYCTSAYPPINSIRPNDQLLKHDNTCQLIISLEADLANIKTRTAEQYKRNAEAALVLHDHPHDQRLRTNQKYIRLTLANNSSTPGPTDSTKSNHDITELEALLPSSHESIKNKQENRVFITGNAGSGKTTCALHIASEAIQGNLWRHKNFHWIIQIQLRDIPTGNISLMEILLKPIRSHLISRIDPEILFKILTDCQDHVLLIADGLDEVQERIRVDKNFEEIIKQILDWPNIIFTGRHHSEVTPAFKHYLHYELIGFNENDVAEYVTDYFDVLQKKEAGNIVNRLIANKTIPPAIAQTPIMLSLICFVYSDISPNNTEEMTRTQLYQLCWEKLSKRYWKKYGDKKLETDALRATNDILYFLGEIAYEETIEKQKMVIYGKDLLKKINSPEILKRAIQHGWLQTTSTHPAGSNLDLGDYTYEFPHLTFAEFCAAHYLSTRLTENQKKWFPAIESLLNKKHFEVTLFFLAGIISEKQPDLLKELIDILLNKKFFKNKLLRQHIEIDDLTRTIKALEECVTTPGRPGSETILKEMGQALREAIEDYKKELLENFEKIGDLYYKDKSDALSKETRKQAAIFFPTDSIVSRNITINPKTERSSTDILIGDININPDTGQRLKTILTLLSENRRISSKIIHEDQQGMQAITITSIKEMLSPALRTNQVIHYFIRDILSNSTVQFTSQEWVQWAEITITAECEIIAFANKHELRRKTGQHKWERERMLHFLKEFSNRIGSFIKILNIIRNEKTKTFINCESYMDALLQSITGAALSNEEIDCALSIIARINSDWFLEEGKYPFKKTGFFDRVFNRDRESISDSFFGFIRDRLSQKNSFKIHQIEDILALLMKQPLRSQDFMLCLSAVLNRPEVSIHTVANTPDITMIWEQLRSLLLQTTTLLSKRSQKIIAFNLIHKMVLDRIINSPDGIWDYDKTYDNTLKLRSNQILNETLKELSEYNNPGLDEIQKTNDDLSIKPTCSIL